MFVLSMILVCFCYLCHRLEKDTSDLLKYLTVNVYDRSAFAASTSNAPLAIALSLSPTTVNFELSGGAMVYVSVPLLSSSVAARV